jgi:hypothetical protein
VGLGFSSVPAVFWKNVPIALAYGRRELRDDKRDIRRGEIREKMSQEREEMRGKQRQTRDKGDVTDLEQCRAELYQKLYRR